ncbi:14805_t:CDS:2, partial [Gigaspora margarita]
SDTLYDLAENLKEILELLEDKESKQLDNFGEPIVLEEGKVKEEMNLPTNVELTPHTLRRCFATYNAISGMPLPVLQKVLGHSKISTTALYIKDSDLNKIQRLTAKAQTVEQEIDQYQQALELEKEAKINKENPERKYFTNTRMRVSKTSISAPQVGNIRLNSLLHLCQVFYYLQNKQLLFQDELLAFEQGIIVYSVYSSFTSLYYDTTTTSDVHNIDTKTKKFLRDRRQWRKTICDNQHQAGTLRTSKTMTEHYKKPDYQYQIQYETSQDYQGKPINYNTKVYLEEKVLRKIMGRVFDYYKPYRLNEKDFAIFRDKQNDYFTDPK